MLLLYINLILVYSFIVKYSSILKYILNSLSYGVLLAIALLFLVPDFRINTPFISSLLKTKHQNEAPLSYAKAVSVAGPAVVNIYSNDISQDSRFSRQKLNTTKLGSGVIMLADGYILTNYHVVQDADLIVVVLQSGQQYPAQLIGIDSLTDLAVLKVDADNLPVIPQKQEMVSLVGDIVLAIGNPLNLGQTVTQGIVSGTGRNGLSTTSYLEFLQMDAAINEGNSGGALVNTNGQLVAINSRKFTQTDPQVNIQGIFFAVPYQLANKVMKKIITHGRVVRGWLGITSSAVNDVKGFIVTKIIADSPADIGGLVVNDLVTKIDNITITSITQALDIIAETKPGTVLTFLVYRNKQEQLINITIGEFQ